MNVTIKDIARLANVSHTTVSRALNDSPLINPETKEKIKAIARELGYTPNYSAKSLVLDRSYNIGLFFTTIHTGTSAVFFYETVRGVNGVIKDRYNLIVRGIDDYEDYGSIHKKNYDGIIVMSQSTQDDAFIQHVHDRGIPYVVLNRQAGRPAAINIVPDDLQGARGIVEYLIQCGHRSIAIIEGRRGFQSSQERKNGYLEALAASRLECRSEFMVAGSYDVESGYQAMKRLLALPDLPTAVFCSNDDMAVGAMKAAIEKGLQVPDDISVAGFDDNVFSGYLSPALTTVKRPIEQISATGALKLLGWIEKREHRAETIRIRSELRIRDSVKTIAAD